MEWPINNANFKIPQWTAQLTLLGDPPESSQFLGNQLVAGGLGRDGSKGGIALNINAILRLNATTGLWNSIYPRYSAFSASTRFETY